MKSGWKGETKYLKLAHSLSESPIRQRKHTKHTSRTHSRGFLKPPKPAPHLYNSLLLNTATRTVFAAGHILHKHLVSCTHVQFFFFFFLSTIVVGEQKYRKEKEKYLKIKNISKWRCKKVHGCVHDHSRSDVSDLTCSVHVNSTWCARDRWLSQTSPPFGLAHYSRLCFTH